MFAVYCLLLEMNRIYVGETPSWRLETRWAEHANPSRGASKWTSKYPPKKKLCTFKFKTRKESKAFEGSLVEILMRKYGLDAVRGGNYCMPAEGGTWWVKDSLRNIPRFTPEFTSECTFSELRHYGPSRAVISPRPL